MASVTVSAPNFSQSSITRRAPTPLAANCALQSPMVFSGTRTLARTKRSKGPPFQSRFTL